jgi:micrococcal nuclease
LARHLLRRRRVGWPALLAALLLSGLAIADRQGWLLQVGDADAADLRTYDGRAFRVTRVVDGDTLDVDHPDGQYAGTRIRLWGVNTPELAHQAGAQDEPLAAQARDFTQRLTMGQTVTLTLEPHRVRGSFGRVLAFVTLPDGVVLNEAIISAGLSEADDRWPHRHVERYDLLEKQAQRDGVGLWRAQSK